MPDSGEKESDGGKRFPSDLAKSGAIKKLPDGFTYVDPERFHELFAADLPAGPSGFHGALAGVELCRQLLGNDHDRCVAKQAKLDAGGRRRQNHQSGPRTLVRLAG